MTIFKNKNRKKILRVALSDRSLQKIRGSSLSASDYVEAMLRGQVYVLTFNTHEKTKYTSICLTDSAHARLDQLCQLYPDKTRSQIIEALL